MTDTAPIKTEAELLAEAAELRAQAEALEQQAARTTRLYIAGPMTGMPEWNFPAFRAAAAQLREVGYDVIDPSEGDEPTGGADHRSWQHRMRVAVTKLMACDGVAFLPGWPGSRGARIEVKLARDLGVPAAFVDVWLAEARSQNEARHA